MIRDIEWLSLGCCRRVQHNDNNHALCRIKAGLFLAVFAAIPVVLEKDDRLRLLRFQ